ncbi:hypothetical protein INT47_000578 [Mucor saturninus]|uniref:F-box domain-containing protein n=1 Tax=Mucor saturninus TaxID=64648 RepID=A0A8H7VBG1_9FUNG|nr:hypothetical protein INT47_000578 [Mucor saturninus]
MLPTEVLLQVYQWLDRKDIQELMYVTKQYRLFSAPFYFNKIQINEEGVRLDSNFRYGQFTQEVSISKRNTTRGHPTTLEEPTFLRLLSGLPNLEVIRFHSSCPSSLFYLSYLDEPTDASMYSKNLQEICYESPVINDDLTHFFACFNFRESITRLATCASNRYLISATSKDLSYYLPQFTNLTTLVYRTYETADPATMFDILLFCLNIVDLHFGDSITPFRAANQIATTSNQCLKRLEISSEFSINAYIDYLRIVQPLDRMKINVGKHLRYNIFRLIKPFVEKLQKFTSFIVAVDCDYYPMIGTVDRDRVYDFLCKLKGDRDVLYDFFFDSPDDQSFVDILSIRENSLRFTWIVKHWWGDRFTVHHQITDRSEIAKSLTFRKECPESFFFILGYAKTFPRVKTLSIEFNGGNHFKATKTETIANHIIPSQTVLDQLYDYSPDTEIITFKHGHPSKGGKMSETIWDLTSFGSLKEFNFHATHLDLSKSSNGVFLKFDYGDSCYDYKTVCLNKEGKKNIPITMSFTPMQPEEYSFNVIIKVHSPSVVINCNTDNYIL